jgi:hypothetical protein
VGAEKASEREGSELKKRKSGKPGKWEEEGGKEERIDGRPRRLVFFFDLPVSLVLFCLRPDGR